MLRFWEGQFGRLKPEKTSTNQRRYSRKQLELVLEIRSLLKDRGFTIAGARRHLAKGHASPEAREASEPEDELIEAVKKEVRELLQLVDE